MSIPKKLYQVTDPKIQEAYENYAREKKAMMRRARAFAKKYGADPKTIFTSSFGGDCEVVGFGFAQEPDSKFWTEIKVSGYTKGYAPKRTRVAVELRKDFINIGVTKCAEIAKAVGWTKDVFVSGAHPSGAGMMYFFSFFARYKTKTKLGFYGFTSPACKENKNKFKSRGIKEIKTSTYYKEMGD